MKITGGTLSDNRFGVSKWRLVILVMVAAALAFAWALPVATTNYKLKEFYSFEVELTGDHAGVTQLFYDIGHGIHEADSTSQSLPIVAKAKRIIYNLPAGEIRLLRFDFNNKEGHYTFKDAVVRGADGSVLYRFAPADFHPDSQIAQLEVHGDTIEVRTVSQATDPFIYLRVSHPLALAFGPAQAHAILQQVVLRIFFCILIAAVLGEAVFRVFAARIATARARAGRHPFWTIGLIAAVSVAIQLHPVIFSGKSFVSPNSPAFMLYDYFPTMPGYDSAEIEDAKGSDVAALMYQHLSFPKLEERALFKDFELPLWNRYDLAGTPLLGQGQSMFGEILNFIPFIAKSAAWAWDLKFVLSRWLFAFGLGAFVWMATRRLAAAGTIALVAVWCGYFAFRATHPAQFSVDYAPLVLLAWAFIDAARTRRGLLMAVVTLFIANWEMFTSGSVKEAYMTMLCMDVAGLFYLVFRTSNLKLLGRKIGAAALAGAVFILISTPCWWLFVDTLKMSRTSYDIPLVNRPPGWVFISVFEDLFYRRFAVDEIHGNPSTNVVVGLALAWLVASLVFRRSRTKIALLWGIAVPASFAFGPIPKEWILHTPFLANIHHVGNTFGCPLIVLLIAAAGVGIADLLTACDESRTPRTVTIAAIAAGLCIGLYALYASHTTGASASDFFKGYIPQLGVGSLTLIGVLCSRRYLTPGIFLTALLACFATLLWRHGQYNHVRFDEYVFNPQVRVDLNTPAPSLEHIKSLGGDPVRITGFDNSFFPGVSQLYLRENIYGVEAVRNPFYDELLNAGGLRKVTVWGLEDSGDERTTSRGMMDMLNVRYYLDNAGNKKPVLGLSTLFQDDMRVRVSPTVWPRAFFTNNLIDEPDLSSLAELFRKSNGQPFAAIGEEAVPSLTSLNVYREASEPSVTEAAHHYLFTTNTTAFTVDAKTPGLIVLTEAYYPRDFRAYLNDVQVPYVRVNHAFKGIAVTQPGTYVVRFEYWPHHLTIALCISLAGFLLGIGLLVTFGRKNVSFSIS